MPPFATQEKVAAGFKAAGKKIEGVESQIAEIDKGFDMLQKQLRRVNQSIGSGKHFDPERGTSVWDSEEQAKEFGEFVLMAMEKKAMGEAVDSAGGILVPDEMASRLIDLLGSYGKFRSNCTIIKTESARVFIPELSSDLVTYCPGENSNITKSDAQVRHIEMRPKTWASLIALSMELEEDASAAIGEIVAKSMMRSMAKQEDLVGFIGDGTSVYFGLTGIVGAFHSISDTISDVAGLHIGTGNAYSELTLADFRSVVALLPEEYDADAKWFVSKKFYHQVMWNLAATSGVAGIFEILSDKKADHFLGYPVEFIPAMPNAEANSQICAVLGDLKMGAYLCERKGIRIEGSSDVYFESYQKGVRAIQRIDVNCFGVGDDTNPGPIVGLITAAS